jgi:hypothetical protein
VQVRELTCDHRRYDLPVRIYDDEIGLPSYLDTPSRTAEPKHASRVLRSRRDGDRRRDAALDEVAEGPVQR